MSQNYTRVPGRLSAVTVAALLTLQLSGCWIDDDDNGPVVNTLPANTVSLSRTAYTATAPGDGRSAATQDLLTGGLGRTGLGTAAASYADPANPTALELRRNALLSNYRGLVDVNPNGGYGRLYGPNIDLAGNDTLGEGLIPGVEYVGVLDNADGTKRVTMAVQVPSSFNQNDPCIVLAPSSGSRGVYGAIGAVAEWGLKRGCAVALTDAGKGVGLHDLTDDTVNRIDGTRATRSTAGTLANFAAQISDAARAAFVAALPGRVALKQAHSQINPEKDWGNDTLGAARYALWVLNQEYGPTAGNGTDKLRRYVGSNTRVIAASVSNGGTAVLRAAEADTEGLIDAVVAGEPGASPQAAAASYGVQQGGTAVGGYGKPLYDYFSFANLYQPCAALAPEAAVKTAAGAYEVSTYNLFNPDTVTGAALFARATARCTALAANGLVTGADTASQATDALNRLRNYGWGTYNDTMHNAHYGLGNAWIVTSMYANAYGRFPVTDSVCGVSFAGADAAGSPAPLATATATSALTKAQSFAAANGTANGTPVAVIVNGSVGGAKRWELAASPSTGGALDFGFDAAVCLRALYTGTDPRTGAALTASTTPTLKQSQDLRAGVAETLASANLRGKPTLIVAGRSDALLPVNNAARAYVAANRVAEGAASPVRYVEVTNGQHFDGFLGFPGFDTRFVPLHAYFLDALNAMHAHLTSGAALPASQVVRTLPRGGTPGAAPAVTRAANLPPIAATPAPADAISFSGNAISVPN